MCHSLVRFASAAEDALKQGETLGTPIKLEIGEQLLYITASSWISCSSQRETESCHNIRFSFSFSLCNGSPMEQPSVHSKPEKKDWWPQQTGGGDTDETHGQAVTVRAQAGGNAESPIRQKQTWWMALPSLAFTSNLFLSPLVSVFRKRIFLTLLLMD